MSEMELLPEGAGAPGAGEVTPMMVQYLALKAEAEGGAVHLAGMQPVVARVFEITGADAVFSVHGTLDQALVE